MHKPTRTSAREYKGPVVSPNNRTRGVGSGFGAGLTRILLGALLCLAAAGAWWLFAPMGQKAPTIDVQIPQGSSAGYISKAINAAGVNVSPKLLSLALWASGASDRLKPGTYVVKEGMSVWDLVQKLLSGKQKKLSVRFGEGWNFRQLRAALDKNEILVHQTTGMNDAALMTLLGRPGLHPEGRFFPDTYVFNEGTTDLSILKQALAAMDKELQKAWEQRATGLALRSPEEALIMASIIEKETGLDADRGMISGVFDNRLKQGMKLQTDPAVIYGVGEAFAGDITRKHLSTDTPYNTYTRKGLPPTPIAAPSAASLIAAVKPAETPALYFVAKGDGSSYFSATLAEHNAAVRKYLAKKSP